MELYLVVYILKNWSELDIIPRYSDAEIIIKIKYLSVWVNKKNTNRNY